MLNECCKKNVSNLNLPCQQSTAPLSQQIINTGYKPTTTSRLVPTTSPPSHPCNISVHVAFVHSMICQYSISVACIQVGSESNCVFIQ